MSDWKPFEPQVMDWQFCLIDGRTRPEPFAVVVDAINTDARGGRHVKPCASEAVISIRNAIELLSSEVSSMNVCYAVLHLLFAFQCLRHTSPTTIVYELPNTTEAIAVLKPVTSKMSELEILKSIATALMSLGIVFCSDNQDDALLAKIRSAAWSSNVPGIVMYIDKIEAAA
jgi:hypothetical protein